jgi:hypothetical protein
MSAISFSVSASHELIRHNYADATDRMYPAPREGWWLSATRMLALVAVRADDGEPRRPAQRV